ncbi:MAG: TatD family hydrolase [Candidatus Gracilibacteria bacterium]|nr:TatD family hydrolase [Candidatus Gracilibacteria bacterium]MDD2908270.1 TatD family hydrolase [Candidatus Gracilibacteria bacterium]
MIFDTHSHLQFDDYDNIENELKTMEELGVKYSTLIGSDFESTENALVIARKHSEFFVVAGITHPIESPQIANLEEEIAKVETQIMENRKYIVGIGEVGLDYFHLNQEKIEEEKEIQKRVFIENIKLAEKFNLPIIVHIRDAWDDAYEILSKANFANNIVIHCYTGSPEIAAKYLNLSDKIYFGFSGIVTFKNALSVQETVPNIPLARILVETDAPYLAPVPYRGKLNTSGYVKFVLDKIKELRTETPELVENTIYENSLRFYGITD